MRKRQIAALALAALLALGLAGCGADKDKEENKGGDMYIQPAQLSEEETALVELLGVGMGSHHIFDFRAKGAKSLQVNVYELIDGEWSRVPGGAEVGLWAGSGRMVLTFGKMTEGVRLVVQADGIFSTSFQVTPEDDVSGMAFGTATLDASPAEMELEQEIPLVLQMANSKNELRMYSVDYFGMPRELAKTGYEHIYAVTVIFSAQDVGGAPSAEPSAEPSPAE